jgi:hypothetical protein
MIIGSHLLWITKKQSRLYIFFKKTNGIKFDAYEIVNG